MFILLPVFLLVISGSSLAILRVLRPQFRYGWLLAIGLAFLAWLIVLLWQPLAPTAVVVPLWKSTAAAGTASGFSVSSLIWPYALSVATLALAVLLTAPARAGFPNPNRWAISLGLAALGLLAVVATDALTLVLIWAALDLVELNLMLRWADGEALGERAVLAFSVRLGGILLVLLARVLGAAGANGADFSATPAPDGLILLAAAALRLGVLPTPLPYSSSPQLRGGVGTTLRMASAAASLALLSRIPPASLGSPLAPVLLALCAAAAIYAGSMWLRAPDQFSGRPFWIVGMAALAVGSALRGNPAGATAWGVALILAGAALFLSSIQNAWFGRALLVGAWTLSALPFSLTAGAWINGAGTFDWSLPAFVVAQALLMAGFIHHALRPAFRSSADSGQAWLRTVYPGGLGLLLLVQLLLAFWGWDGALRMGAWLAGVVAAILAAALVWAKARVPALSPVPTDWLPRRSGGTNVWLSRDLGSIYKGMQRVSETISGLLEGEAGIMWSLLLLALFVSLIVGRNP